MKKQLPAWLALCIIALVAGLLLGVTNAMTKQQIEEQTLAAADAARKGVLPAAGEFTEAPVEADSPVDNSYVGMSGTEEVGYTAQATVKGYGGEIEVTVGMDKSGVITGINVGGASFAETAGLGSKAKEPKFTEQFQGITPPAVSGENIDGITGATITTGAVVAGVNRAADYIATTFLGATSEGSDVAEFTNLVEQGAADGIENWWKADEGVVVKASAKGYGGAIAAEVAINSDGTIAYVKISAPDETPGLGERITESAFLAQFGGLSGAVALGDNVDAVTAATISADGAVTAVNAALTFAAGVQ